MAVLAVAPAPVVGQSADPDTPQVEGEIDPKPFDPRFEIREHFRRILPPDWWASDPIYGTSLFQVTVHIPDRWRGNPTSAVMMLCPDRHSTVWQGELDRIVVHPFYRNRPWASIECRR
ncbi:hypothetical protein [Stella sp.]|uniref:hypothetical protein n=1 Tax=Stella sp. TaxID=2912054 RepID=UPI0035B3D7D4